MTPTFASNFDALSGWRSTLGRRLAELSRYLAEHELADDPTHEALSMLAQRLAAEKLVVAFVAEFSRGKSELINAIFFAGDRRRIMPATPGRTTMCPTELGYDPEVRPACACFRSRRACRPVARRAARTAARHGRASTWTSRSR